MHPSERPTAFQGSIRDDRSRVQAYVVIVAVVALVAVGLASSLVAPGQDRSSRPSASDRAAVVSQSPTPWPTAAPTLRPTPAPTLAPVAAALTEAELSPTGLLVADTGDPGIGSIVADVDGTVWMTRAGELLNVDPATGRGREWTLADDPAFAAVYVSPAREGGVWLASEDAIRRFDGVRFRAVIPMPAFAYSIAEGADGSIWAATGTYGLIRWVGGTWTASPPGRTAPAASVVIDGAGRVWTADVASAQEWTPAGISVWDGSAWTSFALADVPFPPGTEVPSLVVAPDGSVWAFTGGRLARFGFGGWTTLDPPSVGLDARLSAVDEGGRAWFVELGCDTCPVRIDVYDGSTVTTYDDSTGLPSAAVVNWSDANLVAGHGFVLASTAAGLYRLAEASWQRLDVPGPHPPGTPVRRSGDSVGALLAMSSSEVWASVQSWDAATQTQSSELFRYADSGWHPVPLPVRTPVGGAVLGPDGSVWLATGSGPLVRRGDAWIDLGDTVAKAAPPERSDGGGSCAGAVLVNEDGSAFYMGSGSGNRLVALRLVDDSWEARVVEPAPPEAPWCPARLARTADGATWLLSRGWGSILMRATGGAWETVRPEPLGPSADGSAGPVDLLVDRDGSLWTLVNWYPENDTGVSQIALEHWVGGKWVLHAGPETMTYANALSLLPDGSLIAVGAGIARFDGERWSHLWPGLWLGALSVASDGSVWVAGPNVYRLPAWLP